MQYPASGFWSRLWWVEGWARRRFGASFEQSQQHAGQGSSVPQGLVGVVQRHSECGRQEAEFPGKSKGARHWNGVDSLEIQLSEPSATPLFSEEPHVEVLVVGHRDVSRQLRGEVAGDLGEARGIGQPVGLDAVDVGPADISGTRIDQGGPLLPHRRSIVFSHNYCDFDDVAHMGIQTSRLEVEAGVGGHGPTVLAG